MEAGNLFWAFAAAMLVLAVVIRRVAADEPPWLADLSSVLAALTLLGVAVVSWRTGLLAVLAGSLPRVWLFAAFGFGAWLYASSHIADGPARRWSGGAVLAGAGLVGTYRALASVTGMFVADTSAALPPILWTAAATGAAVMLAGAVRRSKALAVLGLVLLAAAALPLVATLVREAIAGMLPAQRTIIGLGIMVLVIGVPLALIARGIARYRRDRDLRQQIYAAQLRQLQLRNQQLEAMAPARESPRWQLDLHERELRIRKLEAELAAIRSAIQQSDQQPSRSQQQRRPQEIHLRDGATYYREPRQRPNGPSPSQPASWRMGDGRIVAQPGETYFTANGVRRRITGELDPSRVHELISRLATWDGRLYYVSGGVRTPITGDLDPTLLPGWTAH